MGVTDWLMRCCFRGNHLYAAQFVKRRNVVTIFLKIQLLFFSVLDWGGSKAPSPDPPPVFLLENYFYLKIAQVLATAQHL